MNFPPARATPPRSAPSLARRCAALLPVALLIATLTGIETPARAAEVGWRSTVIAPAAADAAPTTVALYYPTPAPSRTIPMGPFSLRGTPGAPSEARYAGLVLLSHGTGGSELGHGRIAESLARRGYLVASIRHPGDNWQDNTLLRADAARFFDERPRQASRVLDALLRDEDVARRLAVDARGPRVAAIGHSAGGYTVLALAGARPDLARVGAHCRAHRADDPVFCGMSAGTGAAPAARGADLADPRIRAVVAMAPTGVVLDPASLARITVPTAVYVAERDRFLVPAFHADPIARHLPGVAMHRVENAWHFAFMDTPTMPIPSPDGDIAADPPGFDRAAFLERLGDEIGAFLDASLADAPRR